MNIEGQISRRSVLASLGIGAGAISLWPACLWARRKELPELSFVIVSDTHLGYRDQDSAARQWEKTAKEIANAPGELVIHLGDIVDGGREPQYAVYRKTRELIGKPVHEIPGNHDPAPLFEKHIRSPIDTTVDLKWLRLVLLNNSRTDSHDGFVSDEQIEWIDTQCRDAAKRDGYIIVCMHVPAHANKHPDRGWYVKPDHGQTKLYETLQRHQDRTLAVFHGHFHNGIRGWDDHAPVHEIIFPSALYNLDRKLVEQHAPGYNVKEFRPGFTVATIRDGAMTLHYKPVDIDATADKQFKLAQVGG
jgi:hypothetical protein